MAPIEPVKIAPLRPHVTIFKTADFLTALVAVVDGIGYDIHVRLRIDSPGNSQSNKL